MSIAPPTYEDARLLMEYYKLWDTPLDGEAWAFFRRAREDGTFDSFEAFAERVPSGSHEFVLFDRVLCGFEQAGVLMKHGLMHPDLYFDAWASPASAWHAVETVVRGLRRRRGNAHVYANLEWLGRRAAEWYESHPQEESEGPEPVEAGVHR